MFTTDRAMSPVVLAREAKSRGFASFYVPEHTHIPVRRATPPPTGEAELPEEYRRTLDPIVTAKAAATLDLLSRGRLVPGIGYGWNREEAESHGVDFRRRRELVREKALALRALWEHDAASFSGELVRLEPSWSWPKPQRRPRLPILIGVAPGPKLFAQIAEYADGWLPIGGAGVARALLELRRAVESTGRDPAELRIVLLGTHPDSGKLDHYASMGVSEVLLRLPSAPTDAVLRSSTNTRGWSGDHERTCRSPYLRVPAEIAPRR